MKLSTIVFALFLSACTTVHLDCPTNGVQTAVIGGSNIATMATQMLTAIGPLIAAGGVLAAKPGVKAPTPTPAPATSGSTLDSKSLDIFGQTYYSCGSMPAPASTAP